MNKVILVLLILLFFSIVFNGFQFYLYSKEQNKRNIVEKSMLMNEFSDRAEKWRNFNQFISKILQEKNINYPISKQQSDMYFELAKHEMSLILKQTSNVGSFAISDHYIEYAQFISEFDRQFKTLVQRFNGKLPIMKREQLVELSNSLEKSYKLYMNVGVGRFGASSKGSVMFEVIFEPNIEILDKVIDELSSIRKEIEAIE
ncbi:hypothetical protein ACFSCX_20210 [Bacillus salitolerans]|uniref:Uncharacterized protein n=1 Tax=Bacillus salitolerans TaxID=1437434 RepID=A0ABW4LUL4_9BACI